MKKFFKKSLGQSTTSEARAEAVSDVPRGKPMSASPSLRLHVPKEHIFLKPGKDCV